MNSKRLIIFISTFIITICHQHHDSKSENSFIEYFNGCRKQLMEWVGFQQTTDELLHKCSLHESQQTILKLYKQWTQMGLDFTLSHFDLLRKYLKQDLKLKESLKCIIQTRNTENDYFKEQRKFKYFGKFIKEHPNQGKYLFVQQQNMWAQKGKKLCNYFKAFFQYYYLNVLRPSQTSSTTFLRALTIRSSIFDHKDIAYCVQIQTHGTIAENLEGLDINNIYVKIPQIMNAIKFIKFKKQCQSQNNFDMMKRIKERLKNIDMFKIMYHDYQPFVEVAAQKFGTSQIKLLARKMAHIIQNPAQYQKYKDLEQL